ncbi:hypothetical protein [Methylocystis echinoides]|uniref:Uncharacterized protein n=1 Tax=Methylocystis echinoides TaxID=29468 RepID=A0A9W6LR20_9HYPH|nr:hypothetical protein [Methylocystis echinoides]GLI92078.1 hypothetical protein LMG27198_10700 [Methylocystis echinoides]
MQKKTSPPSRQKIEQARLLYDAGAPISEILALLAMSAGRFRRFREANDWPLRASACARKADVAETPTPAAPPRRDHGRLIAKLEDAVEQEFARAETALERQAPKSIESSARALATLVKALAELKRLRRDADHFNEEAARPDDDDDAANEPPRELAELRAELARRLERLCGDRPAE